DQSRHARIHRRRYSMRALISKKAAAAQIGCSTKLLDALIAEGGGPIAHLIRGRLRFDPADIDDWLCSVRVGTPPAAPPEALEGAGAAGFLLAHALICIMRGMGVLDDALITRIYTEARAALEMTGLGDHAAAEL